MPYLENGQSFWDGGSIRKYLYTRCFGQDIADQKQWYREKAETFAHSPMGRSLKYGKNCCVCDHSCKGLTTKLGDINNCYMSSIYITFLL